jgi:hypothetical protein
MVFSIKKLILVPLDILRNNFDFDTIIEELFDFKGDSPLFISMESQIRLPGVFTAREWRHPVFLLLGSGDTPVYSPSRNLVSPVFISMESQIRLPGVFTAREWRHPVYSLLGSGDPPVYLLLGSGDPPVYSAQVIIDYPMYSLTESKKFVFPVYSLPGRHFRGVETPPVHSPQGSRDSPVYSPP